MAGYMKRLNGRVYDFQHKSKIDGLTNGMFVEIDASGDVILTAAARDTKMKVVEKTTLWRKKALVLDETAVGANELFLVENEWEVYEDAGEYNTAEYKVDRGHFVRMHRPLIGEQLIVTVSDELYDAVNVGDTVQPTAAGLVAKVSG